MSVPLLRSFLLADDFVFDGTAGSTAAASQHYASVFGRQAGATTGDFLNALDAWEYFWVPTLDDDFLLLEQFDSTDGMRIAPYNVTAGYVGGGSFRARGADSATITWASISGIAITQVLQDSGEYEGSFTDALADTMAGLTRREVSVNMEDLFCTVGTNHTQDLGYCYRKLGPPYTVTADTKLSLAVPAGGDDPGGWGCRIVLLGKRA